MIKKNINLKLLIKILNQEQIDIFINKDKRKLLDIGQYEKKEIKKKISNSK